MPQTMLRRLTALSFLALMVSLNAFGSAVPVGTVPVGDSPTSLAISTNNQQAVVVDAFPTVADGSNIRLLDLVKQVQVNAFSLGTRLVAVAINGANALIVNEDQNVLRVVNVSTSTQIAQITVGSRPSNVATAGPNTAIVTDGQSGALTFVNLTTLQVVGNAVAVGSDPRAVAIHPAGRYAYVTLGGDNQLAVVDLSANPQQVVYKAPVGLNPVAVAVTPNGSRAVVANLSSNTVTVFDLTNPAQPAWIMNVPVGSQPTALAVNPAKQNIVYVANEGSTFFSVVDLSTGDGTTALTGVVQMGTGSSGIQITSDASRLLVTEFQEQANLRIYDLTNMPLDPPPTVNVPGEPEQVSFLPASGVCSFYIAQASLDPGQNAGYWGMQVLVSQGQLTGGFDLGGGFAGNGQLPGFGAFSLSTAQTVTVNVAAQPSPGATGQVSLSVTLLSGSTTVASASGPPPLTFSANLTPGFYVVQVGSLPGSPSGTFQMALSASGFSGGVVVGGFITPSETGFGAFCVPQSQSVDVHLFGNTRYGPNGAGSLVLTVLDGQRNLLSTVDNSVTPAPPPSPPAAPSTSGLNIKWYVNAAAKAGGAGSQSSPFNSITAALKVAKSGDVVFVNPGTYTHTSEQIPSMNGFQAGVTVIGAGAATTVIDWQQTNNNAVVIAAPNVRLAGFTIQNAGQAGLYVLNSNNVTIDHNFFKSNSVEGLGAQGSSGMMVHDNVAYANEGTGMAFASVTGLAVSNPPNVCPASPAGNYGAFVYNNISSDNQDDGILVAQGGNVCVASNFTNGNGSSGIEFNNRSTGSTSPPLRGEIVNNQVGGNGGQEYGFAGTGILVTENGARGDIIQGNQLAGNRPFGIGIFLNAAAGVISQNTVSNTTQQGILVQRGSTADEISGNTVTNAGQSALFVENAASVTRILQNAASGNVTGLSILNNSTVTTVDHNTLNSNGTGMDIDASKVTTVSNSTFNNNSVGGAFVRDGSVVSNFLSNQVLGNSGQGGLTVNTNAAATVSGGTFSNNPAGGVGLAGGGTVSIQNANISSNQAPGGIFLFSGSQATVTGTTLDSNVQQGVLASDSGTVANLGAGTSVTNTQGIGLNAQNGASINCTSVTESGNTGGNVLGAVTGCR